MPTQKGHKVSAGPRRRRRDLLTPRRSRRDPAWTSISTCIVFKYNIIWTTNTSPTKRHAKCWQRRTNTGRTSLVLVHADATPTRRQVPIRTLVMLIIIWTTYINRPRRHTACRQYRVNVDAMQSTASAPTRRLPNAKYSQPTRVRTPLLHILVYPGDP